MLDALEQVSPACQQLLRLMIADPPLSYDEISAVLDMPKKSIGPTRQRYLQRMRIIIDTVHDDRITSPTSRSRPTKGV